MFIVSVHTYTQTDSMDNTDFHKFLCSFHVSLADSL